ncbi:Hypothetical predicted protein [Marmota monax]|uniref:G-protein coupled receptors family 1 profile domain-containing protein n=1 Tax=Marmota monax TaxID=9995 RepID=A0A5E4AVF5_MARMO|nr:Hypothetical predicted protein [Marmota monax]
MVLGESGLVCRRGCQVGQQSTARKATAGVAKLQPQDGASVALEPAWSRSMSDPMSNRVLFFVFLLLYLSSVLGNGLIIALICLDTHLHTPMYFFLCVLSVLDTSYITTTMHQMINHYFCEGPSVRNLACTDTQLIDMVDLIISVFVVVTPLSLILASYIRITLAILKIKSTQGRCKAFSTCASHLTVVTLFYAPVTYIYMRPNSSYSPEQDKQISLLYNVFTALLNPMVYSLRNKDIKRAFLKVMGCGRVAW